MDRTAPSRPASINYPGRLSDGGDMFSQQRAAHYRNLNVNRNYFEHQRNNGARPERHQLAPEKSAPDTQRGDPRADLRPAPARTANTDAPQRLQARLEARVELRHGFNAGVQPSRPENQVRRSYEQQPQRSDSEARNRMREAARETLRPEKAPERPQPHELNRPAPEKARGLER